MIRSMTGFGRGSAQAKGVTATVEMRSVNNRFCEVSVRMPRALAEHETDITARVKDAFSRGRINVQVQVEQSAEEGLPVQVDAAAARGYARLLEQLREAAGLEAPVGLEHLLTFQEVFVSQDDEAAAEHAWEAVSEALDGAIERMRAMREQEGNALRTDLAARIDTIEAHLEAVEARAPERLVEARARLKERLDDLLNGTTRVDPERLEFEVALLADKLDVTEECVRLRSHMQLFREALAADKAVGRKLNFIAQEINREINTIGSKANDAEVAHEVVRMKEELEKVREQVENVE